LQQQGYTDEQVNEAKAQIADLLTTMNDQIVACYNQFVPMPQQVLYLAQICYASVPGWCCDAGCFVPDWYYDNGCFVGPCYNVACSGAWAVPVCNAYHDHGSHFYTTYNRVPRKVHVNRSINMAKRQADWLRHHGDWHNTLSHDRLLHLSQHNPPARLPASTRNRVASPSGRYWGMTLTNVLGDTSSARKRSISRVSSIPPGMTKCRTNSPRRAKPFSSRTRSPTWRCISLIAACATSG